MTGLEMFTRTIAWGDVPTWIGAVGTLGAVFWAVFLYRRNVLDNESAQARLLAPVGGTAPVHTLPGDPVKPDSSGLVGLLGVVDGTLMVIAEAYTATIKLVSTSDEAFSDIRVDLLMEDGRSVEFMLGFNEMAPHETRQYTTYYPPGVISGMLRVRLRFRDANGRNWERINGQPVRAIR